MKKQTLITILLIILMSMVGTKVFAYDIAVENADGITIYYNYINDNKELEVTFYSTSFNYEKYYNDIVIPEEVTFMNRTRKVTVIGEKAFFYCKTLSSVTIPNSIIVLGSQAFEGCKKLTSITIPSSLKSIGSEAFKGCDNFEKVIVKDIAAWCNIDFADNYLQIRAKHIFSDENTEITNLVIPQGVIAIGKCAFANFVNLTSVDIPNSVSLIGRYSFAHSGLTSVALPNSVTTIEEEAFYGCGKMTSFTFSNSVTTIGDNAFWGCGRLTSITIPNSVKAIGRSAFSYSDLQTVISMIEEPFEIEGITDGNVNKSTFNLNTYNNATLYVPVGTIEKYRSTKGWKDFMFIEEGTGPDGGGETPETKKCTTPTIGYQNGKLMFNCDTEGATCQSTITDTDITSYSSNEVQLGVTYNISVYATKAGYENSDIATATLCWIDVEPKTEGITNIVSNVRARAVLIQSNVNKLTISGANEGTTINVFDMSGRSAGSAKASAETTTINTTLRSGDIGIVKIGDKAVKVLMK